MAKLTIDNLGTEASTRYAQDQEVYDKSLISDARVSMQTQIDVTSISQVSELETLLNLGPQVTPWSSFIPPANFYTQRRGLFSFQVCPSMGSEDKQENLISRLETRRKAPKDGREKEDQQETPDEEEAQLNKLILLFLTTRPLDKDLNRANAERNRYHKG